jgi:glycosyltransferase involved in cell wall biosynthesis
MARAFQLWKEGVYPGHHLWGCLELALMGYEVLIPEPATGGGIVKRLKNDWLPALVAIHRLKADDIVYCGHNILLWTPLFKALKTVKCKIVGLLFAREPLLFKNLYDGVIAHTPVARENFAANSRKIPCTHISWGMDLDFFNFYPYDPRWILSCGKTFRDFDVIAEASCNLATNVMIMHPSPNMVPSMPLNVKIESAGLLGEGIYAPLVHYYYRHSSATLLTLRSDPKQRHSIGLTNLFESMASGRPVIVTRTSALTSEIDVEKSGIGLYVNPGDAPSLRNAMMRLVGNPDEARGMGLRGRELCEQYYNIDRFANDLHGFFEKL